VVRHLSLFSGIGGFDLAVERCGIETVAFCENDKHCQQVLGRHWPGVPIIDDVREIDGKNFERIDIITGGFPCQDVSVAGNRAGLAGERSGLWREFARIIADVRPAWFVIENVPGLLSSNKGRDMGAILGALGELGYWWAYRVLDAQYDNLAQRRERVFIVGHTRSRRAAEVLLEPEGLCWNPSPSRETGQEVAGTLGGGSEERGWRGDLDANGAYIVSHALTSRQERLEPTTETLIVANALTASAGHHGRSSPRGDGNDNLVVASFHGGHSSSMSIDYLESLCPPLRTSHTGAMLLDGYSVRRLTPLECERLQGFPDGWTEGHADSHRYRMLGNAVAVPVAEWILRRIHEASLS
jgi:DNA (cytosine-5)-methyltransferase 1